MSLKVEDCNSAFLWWCEKRSAFVYYCLSCVLRYFLRKQHFLCTDTSMATVRGILVKQFGGPEVLEYVTNIAQPSKPAARQVFSFLMCSWLVSWWHFFTFCVIDTTLYTLNCQSHIFEVLFVGHFFVSFTLHLLLPSVLWHCWLGDRKGIQPVKNWVVGC